MAEENAKIQNPELVQAIERMRRERTPVCEALLIDALQNAKLLTPVKIEGEVVNGALKEGGKISFELVSNKSDDRFFLAFTDVEELGKWAKGQPKQTMVVSCDDLRGLLEKSGDVTGFVVNPYNQNLIVTPQVMNQFFGKRQQEPQGVQVALSEPDCPREMYDALCAYFEGREEIRKAYLFRAQKQDEEKPVLMMIVDFDGEGGAVFPQIAEVAKEFMDAGDGAEFIRYESEFGHAATKNAKPFYEKK